MSPFPHRLVARLAAAALAAAVVLPLAAPPAEAVARRPRLIVPPAAGGDPPDRAAERLPPRRQRDPLAYPLRSRSAAGRAAGHILVRFADSVGRDEAARLADGLGGRALRPARFGRFARVEVPPGATPEQVVARFRGHPSVAWAEVDPVVRAAYRVAAPLTLDDPFYPRQWHLHRIGHGEALDFNPTDGEGVIVAVVDSGVAFGDGAAFPARRAPDLEGTRFLPGLDLVDGGPPFDEGTGDRDEPGSLRFGHGTFVASIIAATVNNGSFVASVAPRVTILPVRVLGEDGFGSSSTVAEGIHFAVAEGARVINLSLGATSRSTAMEEAVAAAHRAGALVVAAAGNDADDEEVFEDELGSDVGFPARFPLAVAVGATDFADRRATYSNFGPSLDLVAPGGGDNEFVTDNVRDGVLATSFLFDPRTGQASYGAFWATGTSFATPHVAGAAALLFALGIDDPDAVRATLEQTARDLDEAGFDEATGEGLLDAAHAHRGLGFTF